MNDFPIRLFTIGFAGHSARQFFGKLAEAGVRTVVDVRLNNVSQLAGFAKRNDLQFFLGTIAGIEYRHELCLAPTADMLDDYKKKRMDWADYERRFNALLEERRPAETLEPATLDGACLLCSEHEPDHCHRRLAAEYFQRAWGGVTIQHL